MRRLLLAALTFIGMISPSFAWVTPVSIENYTYTQNGIEILNMDVSTDLKHWTTIPVNLPGYPPGGQPKSVIVNIPHEPTAPCNLFLVFTFTNHPKLVWPIKAGQPFFNVCTEHTIEVMFPGDAAGPQIPLILIFE